MWRGIKFHRSQSKHLTAQFLHSYRASGIRTFSELAWLPLFTTLLGAVWVLGLDWRLLVLLPLAYVSSVSIYVIRSFRQTGRVYDQIKDLYAKHPRWRFTPITTDEYLEALHQKMLVPGTEPDEETQHFFAKLMLPVAEYYRGEYLRFIVIETDENSGVGVLATFATFDRAWIFLDGSPRNMGELEHFKVLHEVGHTDPSAVTIGYVTRGNFIPLLWSLPAFALMLRWETTTAAILVVYLLILLSLSKFTLKRFGRHMRFIEEVFADYFALRRCPIRWFQNFSAQDIEDFASVICGNSSPGEGRARAASIYDAPLTEEQVRWRRIFLINQINRLQKGKSYVAEEDVPTRPIRLIHRLIFCQYAALTVLSLSLGLQHAELTTARFVALVVVMVILTLAGETISRVGQVLALH